ncbi:MAG: cell division protein FtsA [Bacteroidales bacterium]|nr:cell division protein FtsA [Bacteroidales bacterium]
MKIRRNKKVSENEVQEPAGYISVGLDIGTTKVVAFVGKRRENSDKVEILGQGETISVGVQRGQVINIAKTVTAINHAIKHACASSHLVLDEVMVGIAGQHISSFHSKQEIKRKFPDDLVTAEDVKQLIDEVFRVNVRPGNQIIDAIPQEFYVDDNRDLVDPVGVVGTQLGSEFNIITGSEQHIRNVVRCVQQCDLNMNGLILEPLASAAVVLDEREKESGVALVDIGGGTTDLAIFYNGILRHTAVIPIGGDVITDDIKSIFQGIVKEDAERVKKEYGSCFSDKSKDVILAIQGIKGRPAVEIPKSKLAEVIIARMDDIIERIMEEIGKSGYANRLGCGIVLTGGGSLLDGIGTYTGFKTGMSVRIGLPEEGIVFDDDAPQKYKSPIYSTALGLMLIGVQRNDSQVDADPVAEPTPKPNGKRRAEPKPDPVGTDDGLNDDGGGRNGFIDHIWKKCMELIGSLITPPDEGDDVDFDENEDYR